MSSKLKLSRASVMKAKQENLLNTDTRGDYIIAIN